MLTAVPKSFFSWDFNIFEGPREIAGIDMSWWREKGKLSIQDETYEVSREGLMSGVFTLASHKGVLARAEKPSAFVRSFDIESQGQLYHLRAASMFRREFLLFQSSEQVGSISPEGIFTRRASIDLPSELPLPVVVFITWLAVILWQRDSQSSSSS